MTGLSIALATYNGSEFLSQQLESLAQQTLLPSELVVCDDGSSDDTLKIVVRFARTAAFPVHIHRNERRLGYRRNFMKAAGLCSSELVALCDQDDIWEPEKLAACASAFTDPDLLLCYHDATLIDAGGAPLGNLQQSSLDEAGKPLDLWSAPLGFSQVFRRHLLVFSDLQDKSVDFHFPDQVLAHDQWLFFLAVTLGKAIHLRKAYARYRQHASNTHGIVSPAGTDRSFRQRLSSHSQENHRKIADLQRRCEILAEIARRSPRYEHKAQRAREDLLTILSLLQSRVALHSSPRLTDRWMHFRWLLDHKAYSGGSPLKLTKAAVMKDVCLGLILGGSRQ